MNGRGRLDLMFMRGAAGVVFCACRTTTSLRRPRVRPTTTMQLQTTRSIERTRNRIRAAAPGWARLCSLSLVPFPSAPSHDQSFFYDFPISALHRRCPLGGAIAIGWLFVPLRGLVCDGGAWPRAGRAVRTAQLILLQEQETGRQTMDTRHTHREDWRQMDDRTRTTPPVQ
jgi:hypothetical protein